MTIFNVFTLMGGIAMFLYGMDLMGKALEQTAGSKLQGILSTMTSSPIRGLLLGMAVTAAVGDDNAVAGAADNALDKNVVVIVFLPTWTVMCPTLTQSPDICASCMPRMAFRKSIICTRCGIITGSES